MSATVARETGLGRPDLSASGFVVSRAAEAERLVQFILSKNTHLVVLSGPAASGKTLLITRWLIPALRAATRDRGADVCYAKCSGGIPEMFAGESGSERLETLLARPNVVIADEFDLVFNLPRDKRRTQIDSMFAMLGRAHPDAVVVVVVSEQYMTNMYALSSYDPSIVSSVCEIKPVGLADGLVQLTSEDPSKGVQYDDEVLQRLREESQQLEHRGIDVTFDLLKLLHERFRREAREANAAVIGAAQYDKIGGLFGVVREHMNGWIDALEAQRPGSEPLAHAILQKVAETQARGAPADFSEIAPRFDVREEEVQGVLRDLTASGGLLYTTAASQFQFQPPQIAVVIEEELALRQVQSERAVRIIDEGLRSRQQLGTFLPAARFAEIHRQRTRLVVDDEMVRFLVQCALRGEEPGTQAAEYWLRRVRSRDDAMDVLLNAAFDDAADVRRRVATLLGQFPEPIVRERLTVLALTDGEPSIRAAAVESLSRMSDDALLERLLQEVNKPKAPHRRAAIMALRIFPRPNVAGVLQAIVHDSASNLELRTEAIDVLAELEIAEAADALIDVALNDSDNEDRVAAATALGRTTTPAINERILDQLAWRRPTLQIVVAAVLLVLGLTAGTVLAGFSMLGLLLATRSGLGIVLVAITVPTALLLRRLRDGRVKWRTPLGFVALALYGLCAITVLPIVHGLAHMMVKRYRRGLALLGLEAMGIFMYAVLAGATEFVPIPGLSFLALLYRITGVLLIAGSYFYDVIATLFRTVLFRRAMTREERRANVYRETFHNPVMADAVFAGLRGVEPEKVKRARLLIRRYGGSLPPAKLLELLTEGDASYRSYVVQALRDAKDDAAIASLETLAPTAGATQQFAIAAVLGGKPTARSIDALRRVASRAGLWLRVLTATAVLRFRLSVWPWSARLAALCLVPAVGVLLYHGAMIRRNPAWSQIITLRQPLPSATQKAKIVNFLVDAYPVESAEALRELFLERRGRGVDSLHAALVRGLVVVQGSTAPDAEISAQLAAEAPKFDELLRDSISFGLGLDVLRTMAQSSDTLLGKAATAALVRYVNSDTSFAPGSLARKQAVVRALGSVPYARGLPALDSLLRTRVADKVQSKNRSAGAFTDVIREQIVQTARQSVASVATKNIAADRASLLSTLDRLDVSAPELSALKREVQLASVTCDGSSSSACDRKDDALRVITESPMSEDGYRDLYSHFSPATQFRQIADTFELLKARFPASVWPRKILSEAYHESRSATDSAAFDRADPEMVALRRLDAFAQMRSRSPDNYVRIESDFVEVALTAGKFAEAESAARALLSKSGAPVDRLNLTLFVYMGAVARRNIPAADSSLAALETIVHSLPASYYNNWVYPGTLTFIDRSGLPAPMKRALRALCKEGQWYTPQEATRVISENRGALKTL